MKAYEYYRLRSNSRYAMKKLSNALYRQVVYNDYSLTQYLETVHQTEDDAMNMLLFTILKNEEQNG